MAITTLGATSSTNTWWKLSRLGGQTSDTHFGGVRFGSIKTDTTWLGIKYGGAPGFNITNQPTVAASSVCAELDQWQSIGADFVRCDLLESVAYEDRFDLIQACARARGMNVIATLRGTSGPYGGVGSASAASAFASAMYTRFGTNVWGWEYVNEPNLPAAAPRYTGAQYATELVGAYNVLHAMDANVIVLNGGLGQEGASAVSGFWPGVLSATAGASAAFDAFNLHCYNNPSDASQWAQGFACQHYSRPVVVTESGQSATAASAGQSSTINAAMTDTRPNAIAVYCMEPEESSSHSMLDGSHAQTVSWTTYQGVATA